MRNANRLAKSGPEKRRQAERSLSGRKAPMTRDRVQPIAPKSIGM